MGALDAHAVDSFLLVDEDARLERDPSVAVDVHGNTVFSWASEVPGGAQPLNCIRLRRFDQKGQEIGKELRIDALPGDLARNPSVSFQPGHSRFVVVWEGGAEGEKLRRRIWARVFDGKGRPVGTQIRVDQIRLRHDYWGLPREYFGGPEVSVAPSGDFVVVWRSNGRSSCDRFNISARRFSVSGKPLADEFIVNRDRNWSQVNPNVGHDRTGGFVVVWQDGRWIGTDEEASVIRGRVYDNEGVEEGHEFVVTPDGRTSVGPPDLAVAPDGSFVCAWRDGTPGSHPKPLLARSYYPEGWPMGELVTVKPLVTDPVRPKITLTGTGEFTMIWPDIAEDRLGSSAIVGRRFSFGGASIGEAISLSPRTCLGVKGPAVATSITGVGVLAWEVQPRGSVRGRRFAPAAPKRTLLTGGAGPNLPGRIAATRKVLRDQRTQTTDRIAAAERITCMRSEANMALADLVECMDEDDNPAVRAACAVGVGAVAVKPGEAIGPLTRVFKDSDQSDRVRAAAAATIGSFEDAARSAVPVLLEGLHELPVAACSAQAAKALGRIGDPSGIGKTADYLNSSAWPYWRVYATALAELIGHEPAYEALKHAKDRHIVTRSKTRYRRENTNLGQLDEYIRKGMSRTGETDELAIERTLEHARDRFVSGRIGVFERPEEINHRLWFEWLDDRLEAFTSMNSEGRGHCGYALALASGIATADPMVERSRSMLSDLLRDVDAVCKPGILGIIEGMGSRGASMANTLSSRLLDESFFRLETLRALAAVDPKSKAAMVAANRLLMDENQKVRIVAIQTLLSAGPKAIQPVSNQMTILLDDPDQEVWRLAEQALELIEAEAQVCDQQWQPVEKPQDEPSPAPPAPHGGSPTYGWHPGDIKNPN
jgi:HEAT repeat protein